MFLEEQPITFSITFLTGLTQLGERGRQRETVGLRGGPRLLGF